MKKISKDSWGREKGATGPISMFLVNFFILIVLFYLMMAIFSGVSFKNVIETYFYGFIDAISGPKGIGPVWLTIGGIIVVLSFVVMIIDKILGGRGRK